MVEKDSFDHVVKTTAQWESQSFEYWIIPRGVLCVELTPDKKTKIKIGEGNKIYSQLPYINSETDLSDYYTKEEIDNILAMLNFVAIPSSEIYPTKEALPQTGNRQGDLRFVLNTTGDPYEYLWFDNKWIALGGDLSEYAKKSEVNPRLNALELKAHTHVNKNVLDRLTANVIDDSHKHTNKNILDATTASYTTQDKATLDELAAITIFEGATKTEDGTMGYVPAPLQGQHTYFLKGDGTWAYLDPGDKYKAGEGIYILSGEVTTQTFPFKLYAKGGYVKQYIIYGAPGGVGEWNATTQTYHIPIRVSAEGHTSIDTVIQVRDKLYEGDWINFETQEYSVYRTNLTSRFQNLIAIDEMSGIDTSGNFNKPPGYWPQFALSDYYEIDPDAKYEIPELDDWSYEYANVNMYDANKNRTRTILRSRTSKVQIIPLLGEKYIRIAGWVTIDHSHGGLHSFRDPLIYQLKDTISPVPTPLQQIQLIPNAINTIDVLTTVKPLDVYMETYIPEEPDPEDPLSGYSGIIYNDGVLDVTQEDPNALNELTVHFRENVEKTLTIPTYELPIASDTTLGGIIVGANLTIDEDGVLDATGGTTYVEGQGIEFSRPILETYQVLDKIRKPSGTTLTTDVIPSGTVDFFCDLKYYKYAGNSFLILCYNGESGSFCYTPPVTNSSSSTRMWIYTAHEQWYDLYLNDSVQSSNPITVHLRWGNTMSISFDHTTRSAQNSPGVLPGHNLFRFDSGSDADLYWAKFYENSALVGELVPVIRQSDSAVGMFNKVTETFSTVSGLIAGTPTGETIVIYDPSSTQDIPINAKLGNGLQFDANGAIETIAATEYAAGDGIQIDEGTSVIDITSIQWQQGKIDDTDGSEAITGVEPYLDCEMFEITSHTSMVTLSGTYDNNIMLLWKPYYYDENDDYISTVNNWSTYEDGVQIPINAKYVRFVLTEDETTTLDPNDLAHVEIEYPLEVGKDVITNTGVIDIQVRDRKLIITKHNTIEEIPIPDPPVATTSTPGIVTVGQDLTIDQNGVLNIADINRLILNVEE